MEITFLNIPDNLRPTYFFHFFKGISSGSDTEYFKHERSTAFQKAEPMLRRNMGQYQLFETLWEFQF